MALSHGVILGAYQVVRSGLLRERVPAQPNASGGGVRDSTAKPRVSTRKARSAESAPVIRDLRAASERRARPVRTATWPSRRDTRSTNPPDALSHSRSTRGLSLPRRRRPRLRRRRFGHRPGIGANRIVHHATSTALHIELKAVATGDHSRLVDTGVRRRTAAVIRSSGSDAGLNRRPSGVASCRHAGSVRATTATPQVDGACACPRSTRSHGRSNPGASDGSRDVRTDR